MSLLGTIADRVVSNPMVKVSGRVIVDAFAYHKLQGDSDEAPPPLRLFPVKVKEKLLSLMKVVEDDEDSDATSETGTSESDKSSSDTSDERPKNPITAEIERNEDLRPMTDFECILAVPRVKGFDLDTKEWCKDLPPLRYMRTSVLLCKIREANVTYRRAQH